MARPWEPMFRRIRCVYRSEWLYPPKPTAADLDAAEARLGCKFPASYRAFAEEFGLGGCLHILPYLHELTCPSGRGPDSPLSSVVVETRVLREHPEETL